MWTAISPKNIRQWILSKSNLTAKEEIDIRPITPCNNFAFVPHRLPSLFVWKPEMTCPIPAKIGRIEVGMGHAKPSGVLPPFFDKDGRYLLIGHCPHGQPNNEALTNLVKWLHCHSYIRKLHYWMCFKTSYSRFSNALKKRFPVTCVWIWWGVLLMNFLVSSQ